MILWASPDVKDDNGQPARRRCTLVRFEGIARCTQPSPSASAARAPRPGARRARRRMRSAARLAGETGERAFPRERSSSGASSAWTASPFGSGGRIVKPQWHVSLDQIPDKLGSRWSWASTQRVSGPRQEVRERPLQAAAQGMRAGCRTAARHRRDGVCSGYRCVDGSVRPGAPGRLPCAVPLRLPACACVVHHEMTEQDGRSLGGCSGEAHRTGAAGRAIVILVLRRSPRYAPRRHEQYP